MTPIQQPAAFDNGFEIYAAKWGKDEAKKRATSIICSLSLGRNFGETTEEYFARNTTAANMYNRAKAYLDASR